jgi:hypothetical protein
MVRWDPSGCDLSQVFAVIALSTISPLVEKTSASWWPSPGDTYRPRRWVWVATMPTDRESWPSIGPADDA